MEFEVDFLKNNLDRVVVLNKEEREKLLLEVVGNKKDTKLVEKLLDLGTNADTMN